jgi:hypothetical protein
LHLKEINKDDIMTYSEETKNADKKCKFFLIWTLKIMVSTVDKIDGFINQHSCLHMIESKKYKYLKKKKKFQNI